MHLPPPETTGLFHIVGIGGIGMSAIAEVMHTRGYRVQGSDLKDGPNLTRLREHGIDCIIGHDPGNVEGASYLVISSAVKAGNPEYEAARERGIPIIRRAEMLAELMRPCTTVSVTGTHGKTTTTSLVADLLYGGGLDPTVITGGIINAWGTNARIGQGEWMVVEADESDGTFLKLPTQIGVITNLDPEHMDFWESEEVLYQAFEQFIESIPFYGTVVACIDHPVVRGLIAALGGAENGRRILTYGVSRSADIRLSTCGPITPPRSTSGRIGRAGGAREINDLTLPALGHYNALNAIAALAVATEAGVGDDMIRTVLANFSGVKRRFTRVGEWQGVAIYDDYAHHPVEIAAVLRGANAAGNGRIVAVMQPHRYTRLQALFNDFSACFDDADVVILTPVYSAGEAPIPGIDRDELAAGLSATAMRKVLMVEDADSLAVTVASVVTEGDLVVGLGAGTITDWINALPAKLATQGGAS
ncbi:UDP-N-acetylmuramate--alanine ligase [Methyloceanibacter methanicus]|uniref:UDP-N-acetylmuramate--L-alanine ligase n=1 Tax=Methyloceanibacter methanicus TaxID=1774968 RepID=A0A1E3VX44_9HYPH|nr:UDP-N-acetylmuramate--L-alanine ligase [Methyloceanibacter methanicus]ODR98107.1 UDP-N-acetylmuramate--alanine ligase [Methyloceanibacter methanicus]